MSVKIRLRRMGKKKQPHYRIVVADSRSPRDGRFVENLGYYNPIKEPALLRVDLDRVDYWLGEGATASPTVGNLVTKARVGGDDSLALVGAESESTAAAEATDTSAGAGAEAEAESAGGVEAAAEAEVAADAEAAAAAAEAADDGQAADGGGAAPGAESE